MQQELLACVGWTRLPSPDTLGVRERQATLAAELHRPPWPQSDPTVPRDIARVTVALRALAL
ncbi:MAG TPA: hypothetical protein VNU46_02875 [Gemmatimonadaceae bacterium]|nr:hypothetical protein [Gemmatimonadaceae bacterium]